MNICFKRCNFADYTYIEYLVSWQNNPNYNVMLRPNFTESPLTDISVETEIKQMLDNPDNQVYMICDDELPIGYIGLDFEFSYLVNKSQPTCWLNGICIGDPAYHRMGLAKKAIEFMEKQCISREISRIEIGVFEFNTAALSLYQRMGYRIFHTIPEFTYFQGKKHADIRLEKILES